MPHSPLEWASAPHWISGKSTHSGAKTMSASGARARATCIASVMGLNFGAAPVPKHVRADACEQSLGHVRYDAGPQLRIDNADPLELQAVTRLMDKAGVNLLAGTDVSFINSPGFSLHDELELLITYRCRTADQAGAPTPCCSTRIR